MQRVKELSYLQWNGSSHLKGKAQRKVESKSEDWPLFNSFPRSLPREARETQKRKRAGERGGRGNGKEEDWIIETDMKERTMCRLFFIPSPASESWLFPCLPSFFPLFHFWEPDIQVWIMTVIKGWSQVKVRWTWVNNTQFCGKLVSRWQSFLYLWIECLFIMFYTSSFESNWPALQINTYSFGLV